MVQEVSSEEGAFKLRLSKQGGAEPSMWKLLEECFRQREQHVQNPESGTEKEPGAGVWRMRRSPRIC